MVVARMPVIALPSARRVGFALALLLLIAANPGAHAADESLEADLARGVEAFRDRDYGSALRWLEPVAIAGEAQAQFMLGFMYQNGRGVPADPEKGVALLRQSAEQGHAYAQFSLASSYRFGIGVEQDLLDAHRWLLLSERNGYDPARQIRMVIEAELQPDQIARSREDAFTEASTASP